MQVVLEEALDLSSLPKALRKDLELVQKLEGRYRVTKMTQEVSCYHNDMFQSNQAKKTERIQSYLDRTRGE